MRELTETLRSLMLENLRIRLNDFQLQAKVEGNTYLILLLVCKGF